MQKACKCSMDQESITISCHKYRNDAIRIQEYCNTVTDLQCDIRPGNACLGLLWLADDLRKRLEWFKGPEIASK